MITALSQRLHARSTVMLAGIETRLERILLCWLVGAGLLSAVRIAFAPTAWGALQWNAMLPYALLTLAPCASTLLALRWFRDGEHAVQPAVRLALIGRWRAVEHAEARRHALFGTSGLMVSLMIGIMLNVPVRAVEYLTVMPPVPATAPHWLLTLRTALTFDVVLFSSLYMVAFVAALRRLPSFPRLLAAIWVGDVAMQVAVARMVGAEHLPAGVASSLHDLLSGNVHKVLISIAVWLPYLLLSKRVNVTYRLRVSA